MHRLLTLALLLAVAAAAADPAPALHIDRERITVSGLSSGGHMAHQLHVAYSDLFSGAAILAGGPFGCAQGSLTTAFARCVSTSGGGLKPEEFVEEIRQAAGKGLLADPQNLSNDRVWLFHGALDKAVAGDLSETLLGVYRAFVPADHVVYVSDVPAAHNFPTRAAGNACDLSESPFMGNCGYDAAGQLLAYLYPGLEPPGDAPLAALQEVDLAGAADAGLQTRAYLYVPARCAGGREACALHLVLHGCAQSAAQIGTVFIEQGGYLPWAEANGIVLAFPQVAPAAANPLACWDWWGYTGPDYRWRSGPQMRRVADWIRQLAGIGPG
jgi:predicted esterase